MDYGDRDSREISPDEKLINSAVSVCEHEGGPSISYYGGYVVGRAVKFCVLRYLNAQLSKMAENAKKEALAIEKEYGKSDSHAG